MYTIKSVCDAAKSIKQYFLIWNNKHTKTGSMQISEEQRNKLLSMELEFENKNNLVTPQSHIENMNIFHKVDRL